MDETTRATIKHAEALYKAGRKKDAIAVLKTVNDPVAIKIINKIQAVNKPPKSRSYLKIAALFLVPILIFTGVVTALLATRAASEAAELATSTAVMIPASEAEAALHDRILDYCGSYAMSEALDQASLMGLKSLYDAPVLSLADCRKFVTASLDEYPTKIRDCDRSTGSHTEFSECMNDLDLPLNYYTGSYAWLDFTAICTVLDGAHYIECMDHMKIIVIEHAEEYRACYYDYDDRFSRPGMKVQQCWEDKNIDPLALAILEE